MKKDHQYRIRLTAEDLAYWNAEARALRIPLSNLIREAMTAYLSDNYFLAKRHLGSKYGSCVNQQEGE